MSRSFTTSNKNPTLSQVLFSPHTPYAPPTASPLAMSAWRWRIWVEGTFALAGLEPWEKYSVVVFLLFAFCCAVHTGLIACKMLSPTVLGFKPTITFAHDTTTIRNSTFQVS